MRAQIAAAALLFPVPLVAFAQSADPSTAEFVPSQPDDRNVPPVSAPPAEGTQKDQTNATATNNSQPQEKRDERPAAEATSEDRIGHLRAGDVTAAISLNARASGQMDSSFQVDSAGTKIAPTPIDTRFRIAPEVHYGGLGLLAEADVYSGVYTGIPSDEVGYGALPYAVRRPAEFRQAYVEYKGDLWLMRLGQQTSQWGLGMVANAGNQDAPAGEFGDARLGDLVYRALIGGRPLFGLGGAWRAIEPAIAIDVVNRDATANYSNGDRALQGVAALRFAVDDNRNFGVYAVYRHQRAISEDVNLRATDAVVLDFAGKWEWRRWGTYRSLGFETAYITGTTTAARNAQFPLQDVRQFGAALKGSLAVRNVQGYLDWGYASGDQNPFDGTIQNFRFNPDYHEGFILYDQVLGMMSARTAARASDPNVVGVAPDGVDLLASRGSITGSTYVFPRLRYGAREWLDVYGGPLFAWTTARWVDPYSTKIDAGGAAVNSLGGRAGNFLGTEVDVGVQGRWKPREGITLSATLEVGGFFPGDAFNTPSGSTMGSVASGRIRLAAHL